MILKSRVYPREVVHINMAINNIIHGISAEATDLEYKDSNLTLMQHNLFEENNEWQFTSYAYHIGDYDDEMIAETITKDGYILFTYRFLKWISRLFTIKGPKMSPEKLQIDLVLARNVSYIYLTLYIPIFLIVVLTLAGNLIPG